MEILSTLAYWFSRGGLMMYLLLAASLTALTIILERARYYRAHLESLSTFRQRLESQLATGNLAGLEAAVRQEDRVLSRLLAAGLAAKRQGRSLELALSGAAQLEAGRLRQGLPLLGCLVTLSPLLGLMGTVIGMIQSFQVFDLQAGATAAITGGVGEALVATVTGLGVAVLALLGHAWFSFRLDRGLSDMELLGTQLEQDLLLDLSDSAVLADGLPQAAAERRLAHESR